MGVIGSHTGITRKQLVTALVIGDGNMKFHTTKDGIIRANSISTYASVVHREYYNWKKSLLIECFPDLKFTETIVKNSQRVKTHNDVLCVNIYNTNELSKLAKFIYTGEKRNLYNILQRINHPLLLALWFMDDGYNGSSKKKHVDKIREYLSRPEVNLATYRYTISENEYAVKWFRENWGLSPKIQPRKIDGEVVDVRLRFPSKEAEKLWSIIKPYVLQFPSMIYRFRFLVHFYSEDGKNDDFNLSTLKKYGIECFGSHHNQYEIKI